MDTSVIEDRKVRARTWFERLRDDICRAFEQLEDDAEDLRVNAGDVVIFTEALVHGSRWSGQSSRRVLIYKYCPGSVAWRSDVWDDAARAPPIHSPESPASGSLAQLG